MAGVRTPMKQFAELNLLKLTIHTHVASDMAIGRYIAQRARIGINAFTREVLTPKIRGGEVAHTGVVPQKFGSNPRCCTECVRGGSATVHFSIWHFSRD